MFKNIVRNFHSLAHYLMESKYNLRIVVMEETPQFGTEYMISSCFI